MNLQNEFDEFVDIIETYYLTLMLQDNFSNTSIFRSKDDYFSIFSYSDDYYMEEFIRVKMNKYKSQIEIFLDERYGYYLPAILNIEVNSRVKRLKKIARSSGLNLILDGSYPNIYMKVRNKEEANSVKEILHIHLPVLI